MKLSLFKGTYVENDKDFFKFQPKNNQIQLRETSYQLNFT